LIDEQLTEQGLRYPVYGWFEKDGFYAKFEEFLGDYKDFSKFPGSFEDGNIRDEVIKGLPMSVVRKFQNLFRQTNLLTLISKLFSEFI